jgi:hypothetical protein
MKNLLALLFVLTSILVHGQVSDATLTTQANVIRNETSQGGNTRGRIADMYQAIINSKASLVGSYDNPGWINSLAWGKITSTPTTISDYGITDFNSLGDARWSLLGHTHTFASLTSKPTTIAGYGITDFNSLGDARWGRTGASNSWSGTQSFNSVILNGQDGGYGHFNLDNVYGTNEWEMPDYSGTVALLSDIPPSVIPINDSGDVLYNNADPTKIARFNLSEIANATTRTFGLPNSSGMILTDGINQAMGSSGMFLAFNPLIDSYITFGSNAASFSGELMFTLQRVGGVSSLVTRSMGSGGLSYSGLSVGPSSTASLYNVHSGVTRKIDFNTGNVVLDVGSDATGDMYYRNSGGNLVRLGIGSSTNVLTVTGGVPVWAAPSGGITNSAANNELMKSDGTNAVGSGFSIPTAGTLTAASSVIFNSSTSSVTIGGKSFSSGVLPSVGVIGNVASGSASASGQALLSGGTSSVASLKAGNAVVAGGDATTGNTGAGDVLIFTQTPAGSGAEGAVNIQTRASGKLGFFNATAVVKQSAVTTNQAFVNAMVSYGLLPTSTLSEPIVDVVDSGTTLTLDNTYNGKLIVCTNSGVMTVTIPAGLMDGFNCVLVENHATGTITTSAGAVTLNGKTATTAQYETLVLTQYLATNTYLGK